MSERETTPRDPGIARALQVAGDALFMAAAPDEAPLADECPQLHAECVKQAQAAIAAFLRALPGASLHYLGLRMHAVQMAQEVERHG